MTNKIIKTVFILGIILFIGCGQSAQTTVSKVEEQKEQHNNVLTGSKASPQKGDQVPNNLVCMVNDAYMGKEQIEVTVDGKMYYGCCDMCKERIPKDASVRYAIDPHTMQKVDKATAYIVMIAKGGEVAYFESKSSYEAFRQAQAR
ncbi:hypothetical protein [Sphingobacterium sp. UT-1RO-CII-1]|uniref:hypothetical protein n=1 Tax=Sphingobacterium sp. UT-1RO-CII-1 TaxID=2995225 RepID=UPI00227C369A|nr:hypothetical protein [Sphingobacterium sp. UT-1RO-CII-1]